MNGGRFDVVSFGEILWEVIEGVPHLGGAPFNFAAHCTLCGLKTAIVSSVGDDDLGRRACEMARGYGVDVAGVNIHPTLPTGTVLVTLRDGFPAYDISRGAVWDGITVSDAVLAQPCPRAVYFGTLMQRSSDSAAFLAAYLKGDPPQEAARAGNVRSGYVASEAGAIPD